MESGQIESFSAKASRFFRQSSGAFGTPGVRRRKALHLQNTCLLKSSCCKHRSPDSGAGERHASSIVCSWGFRAPDPPIFRKLEQARCSCNRGCMSGRKARPRSALCDPPRDPRLGGSDLGDPAAPRRSCARSPGPREEGFRIRGRIAWPRRVGVCKGGGGETRGKRPVCLPGLDEAALQRRRLHLPSPLAHGRACWEL